MPDMLASSMDAIKQQFSQLGVQSFSLAGYEADDVLATLAKKIEHNNGHSIILSTDRILCQLISDRIQIYDHFSEKALDQNIVNEKFQVEAALIPEVLGLAGDNSVSIPGVKSIGIKTAVKLICTYGRIEKVIENADSISGHIGNSLIADQEKAILAKKLFTLKTDIELGINLRQFRVQPHHHG